MLVFIDETWDSWFKLDRWSSRFFIIVCVIFDDHLDAEETSLKIKRFRRKCSFPDTVEFKFNKSRKKLRVEFFTEIKNCNFRIRALVVDKRKIYSKQLRSDKDSFYSYFVKELLKNNGWTLRDANIKLDGSGDREFKKAFKTYISRELNKNGESLIKKFQFVDSKKNDLVQLADMLAGAIAKKKSNDTDAEKYYYLFQNKVEDIWDFWT